MTQLELDAGINRTFGPAASGGKNVSAMSIQARLDRRVIER
jgi:hypothetical protein